MNHRRLAVLSLLGLTLAACADREDNYTPVIAPLSPELRQRAEAGDAAAQFALAEHHRGDDDPTVMLRWLRASARQGYPLAQASLGVLYSAGDGVPQDRLAAYAWLARAAAQGEPEALATVAGVWKELSAEDQELAPQVVFSADLP